MDYLERRLARNKLFKSQILSDITETPAERKIREECDARKALRDLLRKVDDGQIFREQ